MWKLPKLKRKKVLFIHLRVRQQISEREGDFAIQYNDSFQNIKKKKLIVIDLKIDVCRC